MVRSIFGVVLALLAGGVTAKEYAETMTFRLFQPCTGSASFCGPMVLAQGEIDAGAPERLKTLLQNIDGSPMIVFDSPGGSLIAGLEMGELIRKWGLNTGMGLSYSQETAGGVIFMATDVACHSACAYAFMGGVSRLLIDGSQYGMHQFHGVPEGNEGATAQVAMAVVSQYMKRMGVDRDLLDVASLTAAEEVTVISRKYAIQYNLDNTSPPLANWELKALDEGEMAVVVKQQKPGSDAITFVGFAKIPSDPKNVAVVVRNSGFISKRSAALNSNYLPGQDSEAAICAGESRCVALSLGEGWTHDASAASLDAVYTAPMDDLIEVVIDGRPLHLNAGFAAAVSDLDPSVPLGSAGLASALLVLLKQSSGADPRLGE